MLLNLAAQAAGFADGDTSPDKGHYVCIVCGYTLEE